MTPRRAKTTTCPCGKQIRRKCIYPSGNKKGIQRCTACRRATERLRLAAYYQANKESLLPRLKAYQQAHPEMLKAARKKWRDTHKQHVRILSQRATKRKTMLKRLGFIEQDGIWQLPPLDTNQAGA